MAVRSASGNWYCGSVKMTCLQRSGVMYMPAAITSKRPARRPGINEPHSVSTPSTVLMPIFSKMTLAISGDSPVTLPSVSVKANGVSFA
ncbi:hypothetical protein D3C81_2101190 [compost metagenome]